MGRSRQLKPSFNKSGENWFSAPKKAFHAASREVKTRGPRHGYDQFGILSAPANSRAGLAKPFAELRAFWRQFFARAFNPYRPELHYMRGPGPAWRAKHPGRHELSYPGYLRPALRLSPLAPLPIARDHGDLP